MCHTVIAVRNICFWLFVQSVQNENIKREHFFCPLFACFISKANRFVGRILFWFISLEYQMLLLFYYTWSSNDTLLIFWERTDYAEYWNYFVSGEYLMNSIQKSNFWVGGAVAWQYICALQNWQLLLISFKEKIMLVDFHHLSQFFEGLKVSVLITSIISIYYFSAYNT